MSKKTESERFTKVASSLLLDVRELVNWGIATGNTTPDDLQAIVLKRDPVLRRKAAIKMIESGMTQGQVAKVLGVTQQLISLDVTKDLSKSHKTFVKTGSASTLAHRAATAERAASGGVTPEPSDKYRVIYADPPWPYEESHPDYRDHYPVMELEAICAVPVKHWIEADAVLFLWVTAPILEEAFQVVSAWGFKYKASFVWDKIKHNMGHYNSVRHELLLICTRGSCKPDVLTLIDSVQSIERGKHSAKPVEFYDIIESLYTRGRRLEMFGRNRRDGWDAYGHVAELEAAE